MIKCGGLDPHGLDMTPGSSLPTLTLDLTLFCRPAPQFPHVARIGICHGCLPSTSTRIKSRAAGAGDLQHILKEFRVESGDEALCASRKLAGQVFKQIFSRVDFMSPILISFHI